ncbi:MAG: cupin domain-containing protein [Pirellulaceae bacterium]|nr:cupin domain-containing protein [Planctomycetales bacterium]
MKVEHSKNIVSHIVQMDGAVGCHVRQLVNEQDGAPTFAMRQFEVEPGGHTPRHFHPYEHEVYVLEGEGVVYEGDTPRPLAAGDVVFVAPDEVHQFRNTGSSPLKFLCLIPNSATGKNVTVVPECSAEATDT